MGVGVVGYPSRDHVKLQIKLTFVLEFQITHNLDLFALDTGSLCVFHKKAFGAPFPCKLIISHWLNTMIPEREVGMHHVIVSATKCSDLYRPSAQLPIKGRQKSNF